MAEPALKLGQTGAPVGTEALRFELQLAQAQKNVARVEQLERALEAARRQPASRAR